jgi:hypothetical protein
MILNNETLVLTGIFRHLCLEMSVDIGLCRPGLDPGPSGFRVVSTADAGGSPAATHFLCFAKESKQRKATPLHRPFGVPKISRQQRAARKLAARGVGFVPCGFGCSPLKQCERTAPVAGAKFWRSNMGNLGACSSTVASRVAFQKLLSSRATPRDLLLAQTGTTPFREMT